MNDYMKLLAHAAAKYTGEPAVLSPLLDNYCGWENKKARLSSEPAKNDTRIILSTSGLSVEELDIEFDGCLKVSMKHDTKSLGENNFNWSRDCSYKYAIGATVVPLLSAYWTSDDFLIIQARDIDSSLAHESEVANVQKFKLLPVDDISVLEPSLNVPFLRQILKTAQKKSADVFSYVNTATDVREASDVLALLKCMPLNEDKKFDFDLEDMFSNEHSQDDSDPEDKSSKKRSASRPSRKTTKAAA